MPLSTDNPCNLVILCDGTGQDRADPASNVVHLARRLPENAVVQPVCYIPGLENGSEGLLGRWLCPTRACRNYAELDAGRGTGRGASGAAGSRRRSATGSHCPHSLALEAVAGAIAGVALWWRAPSSDTERRHSTPVSACKAAAGKRGATGLALPPSRLCATIRRISGQAGRLT